MAIIETLPNTCKSCYSCVRVCPVKAIKVSHGIAEVVEEKCVYCGRCLTACSFGAKKARDDKEKVLNLLRSDKKTVALLSREFVASFHPISPNQVEVGLEKLGFFAVEEMTLGDEIVADEYLKLVRTKNGHMLIRSTCPVITKWVERYHPELSLFLAAIVPPAIAQGKLAKSTYAFPVATVYIGPCVAMKAEIEQSEASEAINAALTFEELKEMFAEAEIDLTSLPDVGLDSLQPALVRTYSICGGFPRETLASHSLIDSEIKVLRGIEGIEKFVQATAVRGSNSCLVDALSCGGSCIDSPAMDSDLNTYLRKDLVHRFYEERVEKAPRHVAFPQIQLRLPPLDLSKKFHEEPVANRPFDEKQIKQILLASEKNTPEDELNCGACGYTTCREEAIAISEGMAEWEMCFPFQKKIYQSMLEEMKTASTIDGLTGLFNYNALTEHLEVEMKKSKRYNYSLSLIMLDIDLFKQVNDTYGHIIGDELIKSLAEVIRHNVREADLAARYGGDEFALVLTETSKAQAYLVAEKLRRLIESHSFILSKEISLSITVSLGIAVFIPDKDSFKPFIDRADRAMYLAKQAGRNYTELSEEW